MGLKSASIDIFSFKLDSTLESMTLSKVSPIIAISKFKATICEKKVAKKKKM